MGDWEETGQAVATLLLDVISNSPEGCGGWGESHRVSAGNSQGASYSTPLVPAGQTLQPPSE